MKILAVCGFGVGSSMVLKNNLAKAFDNAKIKDVDIITSDLASVKGNNPDVIFTSEELGAELKKDKSINVPIFIVKNFLDLKEIQIVVNQFLEKKKPQKVKVETKKEKPKKDDSKTKSLSRKKIQREGKWQEIKKSTWFKWFAPVFVLLTIFGLACLEVYITQNPSNADELFKGVLAFFTDGILQSAALFLGIIALCGMLLMKKSMPETIKGTFNTIIGVTILGMGTDFLIGSILPLNEWIRELMGLPPGVDDSGGIIASKGTIIGLSMLIAFLVNLVVARFTPIKHIFLTGHMMFWFSFIFVAAGSAAGITNDWALLGFSSVLLSLYFIIGPLMLTPFVQNVTGKKDMTLGHAAGFLAVGAGLTARATKKFSKKASISTEDINIPDKVGFLRETSLVAAIIVFLVYFIVGYVGIGEGVILADTLVGGSVFLNALIQGIAFGAGLSVLMYGVRLMLGALVPAFEGISKKLVPNSIPALDCPVIFPYAPNAVLISFATGFVISTITLVIIVTSGLASTMGIVLLPLTVTCFFEIGTAGVIANSYDGLRGTLVGVTVSSIVMMFVLAGSMATLSNVEGWLAIFGGNDFSLFGMIGYGFGQLVTL